MDVHRKDNNFQNKDNNFKTKGNICMWIEKLREAKANSGMSMKQISDASGVTEKTLTRIFAGGASMPRFGTLGDIAVALGTSLEEIFSESNARVASGDLIDVQGDVERLKAEIDLLKAENAMLKDKVGNLTAENDILRMKLEHKEEIISLHNYYNSLINK
jgi:transcriptional regulator with XRE-family HTH domain